jgi:hypothetical protein
MLTVPIASAIAFTLMILSSCILGLGLGVIVNFRRATFVDGKIAGIFRLTGEDLSEATYNDPSTRIIELPQFQAWLVQFADYEIGGLPDNLYNEEPCEIVAVTCSQPSNLVCLVEERGYTSFLDPNRRQLQIGEEVCLAVFPNLHATFVSRPRRLKWLAKYSVPIAIGAMLSAVGVLILFPEVT